MAKVRALHASTVLHLRIELRLIEPEIWRQVIVPNTITLVRLHHVIQAAMGWTNSHLHEFEIGGLRYGEPDPDWDYGDSIVSEKRVHLLKALAGRKTFDYLYDFGDGWAHKITIKKSLPNTMPMPHAICLDGGNACPPEDVGGPYGYADYVAAISDENHPEHEAMIEWSYEDFDPAVFNLEITNRILNTIKL